MLYTLPNFINFVNSNINIYIAMANIKCLLIKIQNT
jgi:hypothetical protein